MAAQQAVKVAEAQLAQQESQFDAASSSNADTVEAAVEQLRAAKAEVGELQAALQLTNIDTSTAVTNIQYDVSEQDFKTVVVMTFGTNGASVANRVGTGVLGNSLADGNYRLDVLAAQVSDPTGGAGLAADFEFGNDVAADVPNDGFFRQFGDGNGDGFSDFTDFSDDFLAGFGTADGDAGFRAFMDGNGDGFQDFTDFSDDFLPNFGTERA